MPRAENGLVAKACGDLWPRTIRDFELNQFCPEASAILVLMAGRGAIIAAGLRRVPLPGTCIVAEGENCFELCCHSKLQINAAETICPREIRGRFWQLTLFTFCELARGHFEILA